jgi:hypothetical protein
VEQYYRIWWPLLAYIESRPSRAYGVLGLISPIDKVIGPDLPLLVDATLLPFHDKIIYDGILAPYSIYFGPGIRADLNKTYRDIKEREGITTSLLPPATPPAVEQVKAVRDLNCLWRTA